MNKPSHDHSIEDEPHLRDVRFQGDPSESKTDKTLDQDATKVTLDDEIEHTVWDEPGRSDQLTGPAPADALDYPNWLRFRREQTTAAKSWFCTLGLVLLAGPWAILGTFISGTGGSGRTLPYAMALMLVVIGPITEEIMKIAFALYIVEKKPFLFRSPLQIFVTVLAGAFVFAAIENILYLYVYVPEASSELVVWRWTVCVALHVSCSLIAAIGLTKIWKLTWTHLQRPQISHAYPFIVTAVIVHGVYNAFAIFLSFTEFQF